MEKVLSNTVSNPLAFMNGGGEMGVLTRALNWSETLVGPPEYWPKSLQAALAIILHSKFPMFIFWGRHHICFYNDAYRPSLGKDGKHPVILGQPGKEAWGEIWNVIYPLIQQVLNGGDATWSDDQLLPIYRNGTLEDVYWTYSYSRIPDDEGQPGGVLVTCVETTEKVLNQQRLSESNDLMVFSTEAAELGTWDYNPLTGKFTCNDRIKAWFGLAQNEETDLQHAVVAIAKQDRQRVIDAISASIDFGKQAPYDIEYTIIHPQTKVETVVLARGKPFFDENGVAYRFSGIIEDITQKDTAKKLREESEKNLRNLVEQAPVSMCVLMGGQHVVEIANEKMIALWGKTREEVMRRPLFEGLKEAKEQGLESLLDHVYRTGERFTARERPVNLPREHGIETVYLNFVYEALLGEKNQIYGVIAVAIDVTEQVLARRKVEEAEERARLAVEAGKLGTFDFDIKNRIAITSQRFNEIFDAESTATHEELLSRIHPDDRPIRDKALAEATRTGYLFYEVRVVRREGGITWVRIDGKVTRNADGEPARILGTAIDFTESRELEQERDEYIAIACHELKNPLTSLKLSLDLLSMQSYDSAVSFLVQKSKDQVKRLITMSNELLNVSKIAAGVLDIKPEIFNLDHSIRDSIDTVQAGTSLDIFSVSGITDISVRGDRFRIEQVMVNLLSNAVKYSPKGSPVTIIVARDENYVRITVRDKGIGIDTDKVKFVFQKFSRVEPGKGIEGYGLGLYISQQIIRKHGGEIGVESEKGKGSAFWFTIPH
ncbi:MAG: ATP-binding protein [Chitinophagaceae bacterium]